jgi:hypothetical protein
VRIDIDICREPLLPTQKESLNKLNNDLEIIPTPMQEIAHAPALWLWDYLRRSGARGFFLPLSGGADSASTLAIVASMARIVFESI